jgi:hypothetical protein
MPPTTDGKMKTIAGSWWRKRRLCRIGASRFETERNIQLRAKEEQIVHLKDKQRCAIAVLEGAHNEMVAKDSELQVAKAAVIAKNEELVKVRCKSAEDIHAITKASGGNRKARKAKLEAAELKIYQMDTDIKDTFQAQHDDIERLTKDNHRLQNEVNLVSDAHTGCHPDIKGLRNIVAETDAMWYGMTKPRTEKTILEENIQNTLEAMQQDRDHWKIAHDAETQAQTEVYNLRD